jgi:LacI family transcriptional regulator
MRDVARAANVSLKTVSRFVNGQGSVSEEVAARVRDAITDLHYRRNDIARSLRPGQSSSTIGLVIPTLRNPFYATLGSAVEEVVHEHGFMLIVGTCHDRRERERAVVDSLLMRRVDGLLLVSCDVDHSYMRVGSRLPVPIVFIDRPPRSVEADHIVFDHRSAAAAAVEHLRRHGHRRIAYIGLGERAGVHPAHERLQGYRQGLAAGGLAVDPDLIRTGCRTSGDAKAAVRELLGLAHPPTAVLAANQLLGIGATIALRAAAPSTALISFGDFELAELLQATVVAHDADAMGRRGAELLLARLGGDQGPTRRVVMTAPLVVRGSGERSPRRRAAALGGGGRR